MHPLAAIGLVLLTGIAWTVTVLTLLVVLAKSRRPPAAEAHEVLADAVQVKDGSKT